MSKLSPIVFSTVLLSWLSINGYSQKEAEENLYSPKLYLDLGIRYFPSDYLGGPTIGVDLYNSDQRFGVEFRKEFLIKMGRNSYIDSVGNHIFTDSYSVKTYKTINYIEGTYKILSVKENPLYAGLGYGWVKSGMGEGDLFDSENGYSIVGLSMNYTLSWLTIELRYDIPLVNEKERKLNLHNRPFPLSVSLAYRFIPGKEK